MATMTRFRYQVANRIRVLFVCAVFASCAPTISLVRPPESYKGPLAEQPVLQQGDFWVYALGNGTRTKSTRLFPNIGFPLWVGKTWSYEGETRRRNLPPTSTASPLRTQVTCYVGAFHQVSVTAGTFGAFQCECQCELLPRLVGYQEGCGVWTDWYAAEVKNIIRRKAESTAASFELVEYKASRPTPSAKAAQANVPISPKTKFELNISSLNAAVARGEVKEALDSYQFQAREAEKNAAASLSPQQYWEIATSAYQYASRAAILNGDLQKAISHGESALEIAEKTKEPHPRLNALFRLISGYTAVRRFDKSREYLDKSLELLKEIPADTNLRLSWEAILHDALGQDFMRRQEYLKAIDAYLAAIYWRAPLKTRLCSCCYSLHKIFLHKRSRCTSWSGNRSIRRLG